MRRLVPVFIVSLLLATGSIASAQGGNGVIVGGNFANLDVSGSEAPTFDRRTGFVAGVFLRMSIGSSLSVQPEMVYSQKGAKVKDAAAETRIELDYVDVPVLLRVSSGASSGIVFVGGPSFGFKLRARAKADVAGETQDEDIGDRIETFDLGLVLGAGFQSSSFFLDGRYQWGLSNINKAEFDTTEVKNRVASIVLGFRF